MSNIQFQLTEYMSSFGEYRQIPENELPEFCFWGRSNVGKSSLINFLCQRKELARTSSVPGKTQTFNLYGQTGKFHFMDLPGYGFAKVSKSVREKWDKEIPKYLMGIKNLRVVFLLVDISIPPQNADMLKIDFIGSQRIPLVIIFTKSDKIKAGQKKFHIEELKKIISQSWEKLPVMVETSTQMRTGREQVLDIVESIIQVEN